MQPRRNRQWARVQEDAEGIDLFGGPCRDRTCGPLIKSSNQDQPEQTQDELTTPKPDESG